MGIVFGWRKSDEVVSYSRRSACVPVHLPELAAQATYPNITKVEPVTAKAGAVLSIAGENLDKDKVAEIYLTDGKTDIKMQIIEQAAAALKAKVPDPVKTGRFSLMILTATSPPNTSSCR